MVFEEKSIDYWSNKNYDATKWVTLRGDWSLTMLGKRHLNGPKKLPATDGSACSDQTQGPQTCHTPFVLVERNEKQKYPFSKYETSRISASACKPMKLLVPRNKPICILIPKISMLGLWSTLNSPTSSHGGRIIVLCYRFILWDSGEWARNHIKIECQVW